MTTIPQHDSNNIHEFISVIQVLYIKLTLTLL